MGSRKEAIYPLKSKGLNPQLSHAICVRELKQQRKPENVLQIAR